MSKTESALQGAGAGASFGPWGAAIGGVAGYLLGGDDPSAPKNPYADIPLPVLRELNPELYRQVVSLNPELESAINLGPSAMEGINLDPRLRNAQMDALSQLQGISAAGGKDAQFMADAARLQNDVNANLRGNTGAIQQNLATRGLSGGMTEMLSRQQAAQAAANQQAQSGLDINAQAQQRALSALMNSANLGGQMESRQFQQQSDVANARDMINRFNAQNQQNVNQRNIGSRNEAQRYNAGQQQNIADQNVGLKNETQRYNRNIPQTNFENQLRRAGMNLGAEQQNYQFDQAKRQRENQLIGGLIESWNKK